MMNKILGERISYCFIIALTFIFCALNTFCFAASKDSTTPYLVAVVDFENETGSPTNTPLVKAMTDSVITRFVKSDSIQVVERSRIAKIFDEQKLVVSGLIDTGKLAHIGKMLAAEHIVLGSLSRVSEHWMVNMRLLEVKTGRILLAEMFQTEDQVNILPKTRDMAETFVKKISLGKKENYLMTLIVSPKDKRKKKLTPVEQKKLITILKKKVEAYGSSVGKITLQNDKVEILVRGVSEPLELAAVLISNDSLEFRFVDERFDPSASKPPAGSELLPVKGGGSEKYLALHHKVEMMGDHIKSASISIDQWQRQAIVIHFDPIGKSTFARITKNNIGKRLAFILNGEVLIAPVIQMEISGGIAQITSNFTMDEAFRISVNLRSGRLPANLSLAGMEKEL